MNDDRRKRIAEASALIEQAKTILDECASEERDYYEAMPDNIAASERGTKADETADALTEAAGECDTLIDSISDAVS